MASGAKCSSVRRVPHTTLRQKRPSSARGRHWVPQARMLQQCPIRPGHEEIRVLREAWWRVLFADRPHSQRQRRRARRLQTNDNRQGRHQTDEPLFADVAETHLCGESQFSSAFGAYECSHTYVYARIGARTRACRAPELPSREHLLHLTSFFSGRLRADLVFRVAFFFIQSHD